MNTDKTGTHLVTGNVDVVRAAYLAFERGDLAAVDSGVDLERFLDAGDQVVQIGRTRGQARATDKTFDVLEMHVWTVRHGRVVRFEAYVDNPAMLAALR